jgi:mRNA interferase HigB
VQIVGRGILEEFAVKHPEVRGAIDAWVSEVSAAEWDRPEQIKARYARASFLRNNRVVFDLRGNEYRFDTKIAYQTRIVFIVRIGTHAEYADWTF